MQARNAPYTVYPRVRVCPREHHRQHQPPGSKMRKTCSWRRLKFGEPTIGVAPPPEDCRPLWLHRPKAESIGLPLTV
jgi:hypothetical protein